MNGRSLTFDTAVSMIVFPHAKINLGLHVLEKPPGGKGFHAIETVLVPIAYHDILEVIPSRDGRTRLHLSGRRIDYASRQTDSAGEQTDGASERTDSASERTDSASQRTDGASQRTDGSGQQTDGASQRTDGASGQNLVMKALTLVDQLLSEQRREAPRGQAESTDGKMPASLPPLHIFLHKNIPPGSGLGGGSADGTFMLQLLDKHFSLGLDMQALHHLSARLGSDCPFFLHRNPMLATGRGDRLESMPVDQLKGFRLLVVTPPIQINTGYAYSLVKARGETPGLKTILSRRAEEWPGHLENDFEGPIFKLYPVLKAIKEQLMAFGASYASMSGSGSSLYGLFRTMPSMAALCQAFPACHVREATPIL